VFEQFWALGRHEDDDLQELRWASHAVDGALTKAPLDGGKTGPNPPDRGKRGTQRSLLVDGRGVVLDSAGAGAHRNDHLLLQATRASSPARCLLAPLAGGTDQRWLNRVRRILVRWQKQAANDSALVHLAGAFIAFHQAGPVGSVLIPTQRAAIV
jgi:hypothetical protein